MIAIYLISGAVINELIKFGIRSHRENKQALNQLKSIQNEKRNRKTKKGRAINGL